MNRNEELINILLVSGKLDKVDDTILEALKESRLDLKLIANKLSKFIRENSHNIEINELDRIYKESLFKCTKIDENHNIKDFNEFLDNFLKYYKLSVYNKKLGSIDSLNRMLLLINIGERYNINFDTLKIQNINGSIEYGNTKIIAYTKSMSITDEEDIFPCIETNYGEKMYAYILKNGNVIKVGNINWVGIDDDYSCEWIWVKNSREIIDIILKRDYDVIFIPILKGSDGVPLYCKCDKTDMSNDDYLSLSIMCGMFRLDDVRQIKYLDYISKCKYDLKDFLESIYNFRYKSSNLDRETVIKFIVKVINTLDKDRLKTITKLLMGGSKYLEIGNATNMKKIVNTEYSNKDNLIYDFKILGYNDILSISREKINRISLLLDGSQIYIGKDIKEKETKILLLYENGKIKKTANIEKAKVELKKENCLFVITPSNIDRGLLLE